MAIYHCSVKIIGRNAGRSAVAAAAYRSAECLINEYDGIEHDFTKKNWVDFTEIILPENAPEEYQDRSTLWNAVELVEKSKDAQLAREFEVALPTELTREQQIEVVEAFVRDNLTSQGMIADIAIHNPPKTNDRHQPVDKDGNVTRNVEEMQFGNPHAHILCTVRPLDEQGRWEKKSEVEYLCKKNGEERAFTALEYRKAKEDGWEKQYRYYEGKRKIYYTPFEAKEKKLERVNRTPKTTPYGRKNKIVEYWNSKDRIFEWRQNWEKTVNDEFASMQSEVRIDSRSFRDQGRENEVPTLHMGTAAINMEKRADREIREGKSETEVMRSDVGNINRQIREHNRFIREVKSKLDKIAKRAKSFIEEKAKQLEVMRAKLIGNRYEESILSKKHKIMESALVPEAELLEKYQMEMQKVENANRQSADEIKRLNRELKECSYLQIKKKSKIQKQIQEEQSNIEYRIEYMQGIARRCQLSTEEDFQNAARKHSKRVEEFDKLGRTIEVICEDSEQILKEYKATFETIPKESKQAVKEKCIEKRTEVEAIIQNKLSVENGEDFDEEMFDSSKREIDAVIKSTEKEKKMADVNKKVITKSHHH